MFLYCFGSPLEYNIVPYVVSEGVNCGAHEETCESNYKEDVLDCPCDLHAITCRDMKYNLMIRAGSN